MPKVSLEFRYLNSMWTKWGFKFRCLDCFCQKSGFQFRYLNCFCQKSGFHFRCLNWVFPKSISQFRYLSWKPKIYNNQFTYIKCWTNTQEIQFNTFFVLWYTHYFWILGRDILLICMTIKSPECTLDSKPFQEGISCEHEHALSLWFYHWHCKDRITTLPWYSNIVRYNCYYYK